MKSAVCLIFCFFVFSVGEPACQTITNRDFESGTFAGWTVDSTDPANGWSIVSGTSEPSGHFSARCQNLSIGGADHFIRQEIDIEPGKRYQLTAWFEDHLTAGSASFGFFRSDGSPIAAVSIGNCPWVTFALVHTFSTDPPVPTYIGCYWRNASGTTYFDSANVTILPDLPTPTPTVTPTWTPYQPLTSVDGVWEIYR